MLSPVKDRICPECGQSVPEGEDCVVCLMRTISKDVVGDARPVACRLGEYELISPLGQGGMGMVYRALHLTLQRDAAVKMVTAPLGHERESRRRFLVETRTLSRLDHPGILPLYESGEDSGTLWFAMKYARHGSLKDWIDTLRGKWKEIAGIVAAIAEAVHYAHQRGVIHRDIKPSNILFDEPGRPCVADFGIARLVEEGSVGSTMSLDKVLGTPAYMSPELLTGSAPAATITSDIYAVGVVLYELLTGRLPRTGRSLSAQIAEAQTGPPPTPARLDRKVPPDLSTIAEKATSLDPLKRYATAADFAADLQNWLNDRPIQARPVTTVERVKLWARRRPLPASLLGLLLLLIVTSSIVLSIALSESKAAGRTAAKARGLAETNIDYMVMQMPMQLGRFGRSDLVEDAFKTVAKYYDEAEALSPDANMDARHAFFLLQWTEVHAAQGKKDLCMEKVSSAVEIAERAVKWEKPPDFAWYIAARAHLTAAGLKSHYSEQSAREEHRRRAAWMVAQGMQRFPGSPVIELARCLNEKDEIERTDAPGSSDAAIAAAKELIARWQPLLDSNLFADLPLLQRTAIEGYADLLNSAGWRASDKEVGAGFLQKAVEFREAAAKENSQDWRDQVGLLEAYEQLGVMYINMGPDKQDPKRTRDLLAKGRLVAREATKRDPQNLFARLNLATSTANEAFVTAQDADKERDPVKALELTTKAITTYSEAKQLLKSIRDTDTSLNARATAFEGIMEYRIADLLRGSIKRALFPPEAGFAMIGLEEILKLLESIDTAREHYEMAVKRRFEYLKYDSGAWNEYDSFVQQVRLCRKGLQSIGFGNAASALVENCRQDAQAVQKDLPDASPSLDNWRYMTSILHSMSAQDAFARKDEAGALSHTKSALELQLSLLNSPGIAPLVIKTAPEKVTQYFNGTSQKDHSDGLLLIQDLYSALHSALKVDPKAFPRTEWAEAFVAARGKLDAAAAIAAKAAGEIFPAGIPLSSKEDVLKQGLEGR